MTETEILSLSKPGDLFTNDANKCKIEYRELAKRWHPDTSDHNTSDVFAKISILYEEALKQIAEGTWEKSNYIQLKLKLNKILNINFIYTYDFELGTCYVTDKSIIYLLKPNKDKYYNQAVEVLSGIKYANDKMKDEFSRYLPKILGKYETVDNRRILIVEKSEDVYPLSLLLAHLDDHISDKHVAWIISRLLNISCFLDYNQIVHNGISLENCFVSPQYHTVLLYGGWWYATEEGKPMLGTSNEIFEVMSVAAKSDKIARTITDLESIKLLGRKLLGEKHCRKLKDSKLAPDPFIEFLNGGSNNKPYGEMEKWYKALELSYGKRNFIKLQVTKDQIYKRR